MPGVEYVPGDYRVDDQEWQFVKSMETGQCYPVVDGVTDFYYPYAGLNELLRDRHPATTPSGRQRGFSAKTKIRFLGVLLAVWEGRGELFILIRMFRAFLAEHVIAHLAGFGNNDFTLPHDIPRLLPEQLAIAGPQPDVYSADLVRPYDNEWSKRGRVWSTGAPEDPYASANPRRSKKRARVSSSSSSSAGAPAASVKRARHSPAPAPVSRAVSRLRARVVAAVPVSIAHMQAARRARKKSVARAVKSKPQSVQLSRSKQAQSNKQGARKCNTRAQAKPSSGGGARAAAGGGGGLARRLAEEEDGGFGARQLEEERGAGFGARRLAPQSHPDSGVLFNAPFNDSRFLLVSSINSRGRELQGVVDDLYDSQVMQNPEEGIRMLQRWLKALHEGGDRAIARIRHDWGEPPLSAEYPRAAPIAPLASAAGGGGGVAYVSAQERAEYEARRDAARAERRALRAAAAVPAPAEGGGGGSAAGDNDGLLAAALAGAQDKRGRVYPKGVWDVDGFKKQTQVSAHPPSSSSTGGVERGLDSSLQPLLVSLSQILKEAVGQEEDREGNTDGSSSSDEMSANIAPPPSGPGMLKDPFSAPAGKGAAGRYTPTSPEDSPPPRS